MQATLSRWNGRALWLLGLTAPWILSANWVSILGIFAIYAIVALSLDIVLGRAGIYDIRKSSASSPITAISFSASP